MKNAKKSAQSQYYLEIRDLNHVPLFVTRGLSLREAVRLSHQHVTGMDNYQRVYRQLVAMQGHFAAAYLAYSTPGPGFHRVYLIIASMQPLEDWPEFTKDKQVHDEAKLVKTLKKVELVEASIKSGKVKLPK